MTASPSSAQLASYTLTGGALMVAIALASSVFGGVEVAAILALAADAIMIFVASGYAVTFHDDRFVRVGAVFALWALSALALAAPHRTLVAVFWSHGASGVWGALAFAAIQGAIAATQH